MTCSAVKWQQKSLDFFLNFILSLRVEIETAKRKTKTKEKQMSSLFLTQLDRQSQTHRIRVNARRLDLYLRNKMSDR